MLVGLSLSFCIMDIIEGRVAEEDVSHIVTGTRAVTEASWDRMVERYSSIYWSEDPQRASELVSSFREAGKIGQPHSRR